MVKLFIQTLFTVSIPELSIYWFHPSALLPQKLADLYFEYYQRGSGYVVLLSILAVVVFELLFSNAVQRISAQILLLLIGFFWPINHLVFGERVFLLNVMGLPIPLIRPLFAYLLAAPFFLVLLFSFSNRVKSLVSRPIYFLYLGTIFFLACVIFLPVVSGELL